MRRLNIHRWACLLALAGMLTGCASDNAAKCASAIISGANRLRDSGLSTATVQLDLGVRKPYVVVIYPPFRSKADEAVLDAIVPKAEAISYGGATISPKAEGFTNTLVVWQQGALATFNTGFRSAAETQHVLAIAKDDGSPAELTLTRQGAQVYITAIR
jgi:hypothetical protein